MIVRKIGLGALWVGAIAYAFLLAPPDHPETFELIKNLSIGQWQGINPLIVALFNLMGIWPLVYCGVLFADGQGQKIRAWPFAILSFGLGAFGLLPYLALREDNPQLKGSINGFLRQMDSRWFGVGLGVGAIALLVYGLTQGDWADFIHQWQTNRFIHVMSLDFCALHLLFAALLGDDLARRGQDNPSGWWFLLGIPLLGPIGYLVLRKSLGAVTLSTELT